MNLLGKVAKEFGEYVAGEDQRGILDCSGALFGTLLHCIDASRPVPVASLQNRRLAVQVSALKMLQLRNCCSA